MIETQISCMCYEICSIVHYSCNNSIHILFRSSIFKDYDSQPLYAFKKAVIGQFIEVQE